MPNNEPLPLTLNSFLLASTPASNTADQLSGLVQWTAASATEWVVPTQLQPNFKLYTSGAVEISQKTQIVISKLRPSSPVLAALGWFYYDAFYGQDIATQNSLLTKASFVKTLTVGAAASLFNIGEGESLVLQFNGPDVIDFTQSGSVVKIPVLQKILN